MQLPRDEGIHLSPLEWWYFKGRLTTDTGQSFSYHFVTFQSALSSGITPRVAQLSWADHQQDLHLTGEQAVFASAEASSGSFGLSSNSWRMSGDGDTYQLSFQIGDYVVELEANSEKPAVLHHGGGLVDLAIAGKTYYYSRTDLKTSGTVSVSGVSHPVNGASWMDHQWGDFTIVDIGWDWLSLNLDDGSRHHGVGGLGAGRPRAYRHLRHLRPAGLQPGAFARRRHFPGTHRHMDQPRHRGRLSHGLEPAHRLSGP